MIHSFGKWIRASEVYLGKKKNISAWSVAKELIPSWRFEPARVNPY